MTQLTKRRNWQARLQISACDISISIPYLPKRDFLCFLFFRGPLFTTLVGERALPTPRRRRSSPPQSPPPARTPTPPIARTAKRPARANRRSRRLPPMKRLLPPPLPPPSALGERCGTAAAGRPSPGWRACNCRLAGSMPCPRPGTKAACKKKREKVPFSTQSLLIREEIKRA